MDVKPTVTRDTMSSSVTDSIRPPKQMNSPVSGQVPDTTDMPVSHTDLASAVDKINHALTADSRQVQFQLDDSTGITVVKIMDTEHNTVIRQLPSKEALSIARDIDKSRVALLHTKA